LTAGVSCTETLLQHRDWPRPAMHTPERCRGWTELLAGFFWGLLLGSGARLDVGRGEVLGVVLVARGDGARVGDDAEQVAQQRLERRPCEHAEVEQAPAGAMLPWVELRSI
jgi:hypothetical protein